jgi:hypothetical protein
MSKQKGFYVAIVFGDLTPDADGGYQIDPQGKRDFFVTDPQVVNMIADTGKTEMKDQFEVAIEAITKDIKDGGLSF